MNNYIYIAVMAAVSYTIRVFSLFSPFCTMYLT